MDYEREKLINICVEKLPIQKQEKYASSIRLVAYTAEEISTVEKLASLRPELITGYIDSLKREGHLA